MDVRLWHMPLSHPSQAARLMLEHKGIDYRVVEVKPGAQMLAMRLAGFRGGTVPGMRIDGRRVQGTLAIARELERLVPEPPLYPSQPDSRAAVEEAERWAERELQPTPRRIFRYSLMHHYAMRRFLDEIMGLPLPGVAGTLGLPIGWIYARDVGADEPTIRRELATLGARLDHVDELIAAGTIGGEQRNAADYQIGCTVRLLLWLGDTRELVVGRPAERLARELLPDLGTPEPAPKVLPPAMFPPASARAAS